MDTRKRRQHYVWKHYLEGWSTNGRIFCHNQGAGKFIAPINLAVKTDFYKIPELDASDVALLQLLSTNSKTRNEVKRFNTRFLNDLAKPFAIANLLSLQEIKPDGALSVALNLYRTNILENAHNSIENDFIPILDQLKAGDLSFYSKKDEAISFFVYICNQHLRTRGIREGVAAATQAGPIRNIDRLWPILSMLYAYNVGGSLFSERRARKLTILKNHTDMEFITADQPVINLSASPSGEAERLAFYYPVSPEYALVLPDVDEVSPYSSESLTREDVLRLNTLMVLESHTQIFSKTEAAMSAAISCADATDAWSSRAAATARPD